MKFRYAFLSLMAFMLAFSMLVFSAVAYAATEDDPGHSGDSHSHFDKDNNHHWQDKDDDDCDGNGDGSHGGGWGGGPGTGSGGGADTTVTGGGLYIVQGAPGRDLSANFFPSYPIDVLVNNTSCLVQNAPFPSVQGAFLENAGTYDLKISPANAAAPCTNAYVKDVQAVVNNNQATYVVLALNMQSKLTTFTFNFALPAVPRGYAGVVIADAADAPAINPGSNISPIGSSAPAGANAPVIAASSSFTLLPGGSLSVTLPAGPFQGAYMNYAGTNQAALGPVADYLQSRSTDVYFIVGSSQAGDLQLIGSHIPSTF